MIAQSTIDAIREKVSLIEVVGEHLTLKRQGSGFSGLCPFHSEKTASFNVRGDGSFYHCFGCGASGNVITFVMQMRGLSFTEAVEELAGRYNIEIKRTTLSKAPAVRVPREELFSVNLLAQGYFSKSLKEQESQISGYLRERGLRAEFQKEFGVGLAPKNWRGLANLLRARSVSEELMLLSGLVRRSSSGELYDVFRGRLMFPVWLDGKRILGFGGRVLPFLHDAKELAESPKYMNSPETPLYQKSKVFYGLPHALNAIRESSEVYLVEGYLDVIGLHQVGVKNVVATCGTAVSEGHVQRLARLAKRVFVLFDADQAGYQAAAKCFGIFLNQGIDVWALFLEQGHDPDSFALAHGNQTAAKLSRLKRSSLFECYLDSLLQKYGVESSSKIGPALKGKLSSELAAMLAKVSNPVERGELQREAALRLKLEVSELGALLGKEKVPKFGDAEELKITVENLDPLNNGKERSAFNLSTLPAIDRQILLAVMADKGRAGSEILYDPEFCLGLVPITLSFIEELCAILEQSDEPSSADQMKDRVRSLLSELGPSWLEHWKKAHKMREAGELKIDQLLSECRRAILKTKLNQSVKELDEKLPSILAEEERLGLLQERVMLSRRLQQL